MNTDSRILGEQASMDTEIIDMLAGMLRGCGQRYSIYTVIYRCANCGGLLEVEHDLEALRQRAAPSGWMRSSTQRAAHQRVALRQRRVGQEGVGLPQIDDENIVSMYEGHTNLFWAERAGPARWACPTCGSSCAATATPARSRTWA